METWESERPCRAWGDWKFTGCQYTYWLLYKVGTPLSGMGGLEAVAENDVEMSDHEVGTPLSGMGGLEEETGDTGMELLLCVGTPLSGMGGLEDAAETVNYKFLYVGTPLSGMGGLEAKRTG